MKDLGTLGGSQTFAADLNNFGQVTGSSNLKGDTTSHAFLYSHGRIKDLGTLGGELSDGCSINDAGEIAGTSMRRGTTNYHAVLFSRGRIIDLGTLGGLRSFARGINNRGEITGESLVANGQSHAFLYSHGRMKDLGTFGGTGGGVGMVINDAGEIGGYTYSEPDHWPRAIVYSGGQIIDLGALANASIPFAMDINRWGEVTGSAVLPVNPKSGGAFLFSNGRVHILGGLGDTSDGYGVNRWGQVVGCAYSLTDRQQHAFLLAGAMHDLNDLVVDANGWVLTCANAINDVGQIVAVGISIRFGPRHSFLLTPIPTLDGCLGHSRDK